ncbi:MAG: outer membrane lipoprotein-sorting protein [Chitinispirillaceae bacterium]
MRYITTAVLLLIALGTGFAMPGITELLTALDENYSMTADVSAKVDVTQQKTGQGTKKLEMMYYRRDCDKSFLIVMLNPSYEKGNGYLRIKDNFWMYRRNTRTFQHINRDESIGGTNARGQDFEGRKITELFEGVKDKNGKELISLDTLGKIPVYKFEVKAIVNDVDYPRKTYWVRQDSKLALKEASYSNSGSLMQTTYYLKYTKVKDSFIPVRQMFIDEFEKGNKTVVEISAINTDKLDNTIFTKAYLENLSK